MLLLGLFPLFRKGWAGFGDVGTGVGDGLEFDQLASGGLVRSPRTLVLAQAWVELQRAVNCLCDNTLAHKAANDRMPAGIKQIFEKKQGPVPARHLVGCIP